MKSEEKCELGKIVGDIFLNEGIDKLKKRDYADSFSALYFSNMFYAFCENSNGMYRCKTLINFFRRGC